MLRTTGSLRLLVLVALSFFMQSCDRQTIFEDARQDYIHHHYNRAFSKALCSAKQGDRRAQYAVGNMYFYGTGTVKEPDLARYWIRCSARQGYPPAVLALHIITKERYPQYTPAEKVTGRSADLRDRVPAKYYDPKSKRHRSTKVSRREASQTSNTLPDRYLKANTSGSAPSGSTQQAQPTITRTKSQKTAALIEPEPVAAQPQPQRKTIPATNTVPKKVHVVKADQSATVIAKQMATARTALPKVRAHQKLAAPEAHRPAHQLKRHASKKQLAKKTTSLKHARHQVSKKHIVHKIAHHHAARTKVAKTTPKKAIKESITAHNPSVQLAQISHGFKPNHTQPKTFHVANIEKNVHKVMSNFGHSPIDVQPPKLQDKPNTSDFKPNKYMWATLQNPENYTVQLTVSNQSRTVNRLAKIKVPGCNVVPYKFHVGAKTKYSVACGSFQSMSDAKKMMAHLPSTALEHAEIYQWKYLQPVMEPYT